MEKRTLKIAVDLMMTGALLLLMGYSLIGEAAHEWIGVVMLCLFLLHHFLNIRWWRGLGKGKYTPLRTFQTGLVFSVLLCMLGSMVSGILLSRYVFRLDVHRFSAFLQTVHMLSAYWGFVLMSVHLGSHWNAVAAIAFKGQKAPSATGKRVLRISALLIAARGVWVFFQRHMGGYMLLKYHFVFFAPDESALLFLLDYLSVLALFACIGYAVTKALASKRDRAGSV